jgi:hypothetical protein
LPPCTKKACHLYVSSNQWYLAWAEEILRGSHRSCCAALSFFDDGDLTLLPEDIKLRLATAAREVDLDHLPGIDKFSRQIDQDRGYEL